MTFHFLRPPWLVALLPALLLWWLHRRHADTTRRWRAVIDPVLLRHLVVSAARGSRLRPADALLAGWVLGTVAIAGPTWQRAPSPFAEDAPPVLIVLKVTPSMATPDLKPTRLTRAQEKIADLLKLHAGQAAGLAAYAGSAHLVLPPTRDSDVVVTMARALSPDVMPKQGDDLADAIALARRVLADGGAGGSILVLADDAASLPALPDGAPVTFLVMLPSGRAVPPGVRAASRALNARVVMASIDTSDVASIGRRLVTVGRVTTRPGEAESWRDMGWFLVPALALIALLWFRRGWVMIG